MFQRNDGITFLGEGDLDCVPGFEGPPCCLSCHEAFDTGEEWPLEFWHSNNKIVLQCCCAWKRDANITDELLEEAVICAKQRTGEDD